MFYQKSTISEPFGNRDSAEPHFICAALYESQQILPSSFVLAGGGYPNDELVDKMGKGSLGFEL